MLWLRDRLADNRDAPTAPDPVALAQAGLARTEQVLLAARVEHAGIVEEIRAATFRRQEHLGRGEVRPW
jgi:hypothetical protein